uniref:Ricin B lectin domain-containing protein n=1 Tax=Populus trichocarpa TaxID=3694 RepID=A0A2K1ZVY0_POPTR
MFMPCASPMFQNHHQSPLSGFGGYCLEFKKNVPKLAIPVSSNQRWTFGDRLGKAYFTIANVNNDALVLDVSYYLFKIIIWDFNGGANQVWRLS